MLFYLFFRQRFFATFADNGGGDKNTPQHISSSRAQRQNSNGYTYVFGVRLSNGGTSGFVGRRRAPEIQDCGQPTGSSKISETMKHIIKIPTATTMFSGTTFLVVVLPISMGRRCVLEIQDGSQITGTSNNFSGFTDTRHSKNNTGAYDYVRNI